MATSPIKYGPKQFLCHGHRNTWARCCWIPSFHTPIAPGQEPWYQPFHLSRCKVISPLSGRAVCWVTGMVTSMDVALRALGVERTPVALHCWVAAPFSRQLRPLPSVASLLPSHMPLISVCFTSLLSENKYFGMFICRKLQAPTAFGRLISWSDGFYGAHWALAVKVLWDRMRTNRKGRQTDRHSCDTSSLPTLDILILPKYVLV